MQESFSARTEGGEIIIKANIKELYLKLIRIVELWMTKENIRGQKLRGWYILYPKQLAISFTSTIWRGLKGQSTVTQKGGRRRGEATLFFKLNIGRHEPEFPRAASVCLLNLKYFVPFDAGILSRVGVRMKKKKTKQDFFWIRY